jgi:hypothetical protein
MDAAYRQLALVGSAGVAVVAGTLATHGQRADHQSRVLPGRPSHSLSGKHPGGAKATQVMPGSRGIADQAGARIHSVDLNAPVVEDFGRRSGGQIRQSDKRAAIGHAQGDAGAGPLRVLTGEAEGPPGGNQVGPYSGEQREALACLQRVQRPGLLGWHARRTTRAQ